MRGRRIACWPLAALVLALLVVVPAPPPATAAPAPWTWTRVTHQVNVEPGQFFSIRVFCPDGSTAITGGIATFFGTDILRNAEYRFDDAAGSSWFVAFESFADASDSVTLFAECVRTTDLPAISHNNALFSASQGRWTGSVGCLNPGEVVLTGGVDWNNVNTRKVYGSGPGWDGTSWQATGWNSVATARMNVEVYCVDPAQVPGFTRVEVTQQDEPRWEGEASCPRGTRVLNGGTEGGVATSSYPDRTSWFAAGPSTTRTFVRAWCVEAGTPTITLTNASPGPSGTVTAQDDAHFTLAGVDPAGRSVQPWCSLDAAPFARCSLTGGVVSFVDLPAGPHQLVVYGETSDGRRSGTVAYDWTIDTAAPVVTAPRLAKVSLADPVQPRWSATDDASGVATYEAQYWRGRADGTSTGWRQPAGWTALSAPTARLPLLDAGDTICLSVRSRDGVGNVSAWTTPACTTRPFDDRGLSTATPGWLRGTGTPYWLETVTQTGATGQVLRRGNLTLSQVGILATVCPGCGAVDVAVGSDRIGRISLDRATTGHRRLITLPAFASRTGLVSITTVTAGKSVRVDGLLPIRTPVTVPPP